MVHAANLAINSLAARKSASIHGPSYSKIRLGMLSQAHGPEAYSLLFEI